MPAGNHLDFPGSGAYAVFTYDAFKKWYLARSEFTLLEVGVQLMFAYKCKNLTNVRPMNLYVRLPAHTLAMDEYIVEVTRC